MFHFFRNRIVVYTAVLFFPPCTTKATELIIRIKTVVFFLIFSKTYSGNVFSTFSSLVKVTQYARASFDFLSVFVRA